MKKIILAFATLFVLNVSLSQNTVPASGNVGINTTSPSEALHVGGSVKVDSCLIVSDSAMFEKPMTLKEEIKVEGNGSFEKDLEVLQQLRVPGTTKLIGPTLVEGNLSLINITEAQELNLFTDNTFLVRNNTTGLLNKVDSDVFIIHS